MAVGGKLHATTAEPKGKRPSSHCIGGWVGPTVGQDNCGKSRPHPNLNPGPSSL